MSDVDTAFAALTDMQRCTVCNEWFARSNHQVKVYGANGYSWLYVCADCTDDVMSQQGSLHFRYVWGL